MKRGGWLRRRVGFGMAPRRTKYNAKPVHDIATGRSFDSKAEFARWNQLELLQRAGHISALVLHPKIILIAKDGDKPEIAWHPDYQYTESGRTVWEDSKARPQDARETLLFKLWRHAGPGLLRITGAGGKLTKEIRGA